MRDLSLREHITNTVQSMGKVGNRQNIPCPVGVVKRSEAPLIEELLEEKEHTEYSIAIDEFGPKRRRLHRIGIPLAISLLGLLDVFRLTK